MNSANQARRKRRTIWLLSFLVMGMFGFGFALVPLYSMLCRATGLQTVSIQETGDNAALSTINQMPVEDSRLITIKFDASVQPDLPWDFKPVDHSLRIHPGKLYSVNYSAHNRSSASITGQAIPSVVPWQATPFLHKLECFCFTQQTLTGNESAKMPLRFMISPDLPKDIKSLTLSYSFMLLGQVKPDTKEHQKVNQLAQR